MFNASNRRYIGAKTKLLEKIDSVILEQIDYTKQKNLSFFDAFSGTGVVSAYFIQKPEFKHLIMNDFLYSNAVIHQAFFDKNSFDFKKLQDFKKYYQNLQAKNLKENYYSKHFRGKFFSLNDAKIIGEIREHLDKNLKTKIINQKAVNKIMAKNFKNISCFQPPMMSFKSSFLTL